MPLTISDIKKLTDVFVTKEDFAKFRYEVLTGQDQMINILKRVEEEMTVIHHRVYDENEKRLEKIEGELAIA